MTPKSFTRFRRAATGAAVLLVLPVLLDAQGAPTINANGVVNATGYQNRLAPDTVFAIFGANMGPANLAAAGVPYPDSLAGTSITFTPAGGGAAITAKVVYTVAGQVAGLLPSSIAPGTYAVRVIYNGQSSAPQNVTVAARSFGIATANSAGTGPAQATIGNVNGGVSLVRLTSGSLGFNGLTWTLTPAHPGDTLVFWGTGGGADPANDTGGTSGDQTAAGSFAVMVNGRRIMPQYSGASSGYPGLWQVNFTLPMDTAPDCFALAQVMAGAEPSNAVTIAIAPPGANACVDTDTSPAILSKLDSGGSITVGAFAIARANAVGTGVINETGSGLIARFTPAQWILTRSGIKFGPCVVVDKSYPRGTRDPAVPDVTLDAGSRLPLTGPNLPAGLALASTMSITGPVYLSSLTAGTFQNGSYTLTAPGGSQVGGFSTSTTFPSSFNATNFDSIGSIVRSQPLTLTWTGSGVDMVTILAVSNTVTATTMHTVTVTCTVPASLGTYSVPPEALAYLQPAGVTGTSFGSLSIQGASVPGTFTASLSGGGQTDIGVFGASLNYGKNIAIQ